MYHEIKNDGYCAVTLSVRFGNTLTESTAAHDRTLTSGNLQPVLEHKISWINMNLTIKTIMLLVVNDPRESISSRFNLGHQSCFDEHLL